MTEILEIRAGKAALDHIRAQGLVPSDIRVVTGASGAAKWLGIYGLYRAIFSRWLRNLSSPVWLYGTSIGAWTLSAGAQADPARAFDRLRSAYIGQVYRGRITAEDVSRESLGILDRVFGADRVAGILSHPFLRLNFSAVRCRGPLAREETTAQAGGMLAAFGLNLVSRTSQDLLFQRTLFHTHNAPVPLKFDVSGADPVGLTQDNFRPALLASGSIPLLMEGIRNIPGACQGVYRDGGVLDYHPAFAMAREEPGLILYPHFYPAITPGWFDKRLPWRQARGQVLDRTILVCPSAAFVRRLPHGRIPDRQDFVRFRGRDQERFYAWNRAAQMSLELGEAFLRAAETGRIGELVRPF